jgi:hypothetical protein
MRHCITPLGARVWFQRREPDMAIDITSDENIDRGIDWLHLMDRRRSRSFTQNRRHGYRCPSRTDWCAYRLHYAIRVVLRCERFMETSQLGFGIVGIGMIAGVRADAIAGSTNAKLTALSSRLITMPCASQQHDSGSMFCQQFVSEGSGSHQFSRVFRTFERSRNRANKDLTGMAY